MFTGLVQHLGRVQAATSSGTSLRLIIDPQDWPHRPAPGDSIAVNGCCLTLAGSPLHGRLTFDAVPETLAKTTLGSWSAGRPVNLEHAATPTTLLGGHMVQGHIDGVGRVVSNGESSLGWRLKVDVPPDLMPCMPPKGSVCVDGVSLTIADADASAHHIEIALIPTTLKLTTLGSLRPGDSVNIEADVVAKTVVNVLRHYPHLRGG